MGFKGAPCVVISVENKNIDFNLLTRFNKLDDCHSIILLRCPYSHFSSVWRVYNKTEDKLKEIVELWKIYSKIFISNGKLIKVLYDKYATDDGYIIDILKKVGVIINEVNKNVQIKWQESSFEDKNKQRKTYDTLQTCIFHKDQGFINLVKDEEIQNSWECILNLYNKESL